MFGGQSCQQQLMAREGCWYSAVLVTLVHQSLELTYRFYERLHVVRGRMQSIRTHQTCRFGEKVERLFS